MISRFNWLSPACRPVPVGRRTCLGSILPAAPHGLHGLQGFAAAQGLHGLQGLAAAQGLQGLAAAHGLQGFAAAQGLQGFAAAHGLQGLQGLAAAHGLHGLHGLAAAQGLHAFCATRESQGLHGLHGFSAAHGFAAPDALMAMIVRSPASTFCSVSDHDTAANISTAIATPSHTETRSDFPENTELMVRLLPNDLIHKLHDEGDYPPPADSLFPEPAHSDVIPASTGCRKFWRNVGELIFIPRSIAAEISRNRRHGITFSASGKRDDIGTGRAVGWQNSDLKLLLSFPTTQGLGWGKSDVADGSDEIDGSRMGLAEGIVQAMEPCCRTGFPAGD